MSGRLRGIAGHDVEWLNSGWELAACPPACMAGPDAPGMAGLDWVGCGAPMTAAAALRSAGQWSLDGPPRRFDAEDWWYRARFRAEPAAPGEQLWLCLDGLATVADLWLNGQPLLSTTGMFTAHERRVDALIRPDNELVIRFHSLDALLAARRPRPRWRTPMVDHQQLRWFRTTLLGRTPGWSPPAAAVGPWRGVRLERRRGLMVDDVRLSTSADGWLEVACELGAIDDRRIAEASVVIERAGRSYRAPLAIGRDGGSLAGRVQVPEPALWWPHTHGEPALYSAQLEVGSGNSPIQVDLGQVGFRTVALDTANDAFAVAVNGAPVFCRGACWTPLDPVSFANEPGALEQAFGQVVDAGMNMLRVGGTMVYEDDAFLDQADARGVLLWQDFMFANLDYPGDDPAFAAEVTDEARQLLARLQGRPSAAVLCGNSEGEQQAAMWGSPRERWAPALFHDMLPALSRTAIPDVPYWPSSAHGGAFPHQGNSGSASYYGVGAYLRPLEDARRAEVRFASECLAFANVPEERTLTRTPGVGGVKVHDPWWKARAPRDLGAGWDFDDVRDHYMGRLFAIDPAGLRYGDHERYLDLGRVVTGEVMAEIFGEWRRGRSVTRGALIWFLRDLWIGAGWGVVDATGVPKAAWHYLRRALAPVALHLADEGGNGLAVHAVNDGAEPLEAELSLALWRAGEVEVGSGSQHVTIPARSAIEVNACDLFAGFLDLNHAYRFGPPSQEIVAASLRSPAGQELGRAFHFVGGRPSGRELDVGLTATARPLGDGTHELAVETRRFAQAVHVEVERHQSSDNYFHLAPGERRLLTLRPDRHLGDPPPVPRGVVRALNAEASAKVTFT